jgi:hypothetical protein
MLSVEHCLRRAERYRLKMLTTDEPASKSRLREIAHSYLRLADHARKLKGPHAVETVPQQVEEEALDKDFA